MSQGDRSVIKVPGFKIKGSVLLGNEPSTKLTLKVSKKEAIRLLGVTPPARWDSFSLEGKLTHKIRQTFSNTPRVDTYTFIPNQKNIEMLDYSFDQLLIEVHLQDRAKSIVELTLDEGGNGDRLHLLGPQAKID